MTFIDFFKNVVFRQKPRLEKINWLAAISMPRLPRTGTKVYPSDNFDNVQRIQLITKEGDNKR